MGETCPKCGAGMAERIRRSFWMRLFRWSIHLYCSECGCYSFVLLRRSTKTGRP